MQDIYRKQTGITPEEEHAVSFPSSSNDDAVLKELYRRQLTDESRDALEGPITKDYLSDKLHNQILIPIPIWVWVYVWVWVWVWCESKKYLRDEKVNP